MATPNTKFLRVVETRQALRAAQAAFEGARDAALRTHVGVAARRVEHENARQAAALARDGLAQARAIAAALATVQTDITAESTRKARQAVIEAARDTYSDNAVHERAVIGTLAVLADGYRKARRVADADDVMRAAVDTAQEAVDTAQEAVDTAQEAVETAEAAVTALIESDAVQSHIQAAVDTAQAAVDTAQAAVEQAQAALYGESDDDDDDDDDAIPPQQAAMAVESLVDLLALIKAHPARLIPERVEARAFTAANGAAFDIWCYGQVMTLGAAADMPAVTAAIEEARAAFMQQDRVAVWYNRWDDHLRTIEGLTRKARLWLTDIHAGMEIALLTKAGTINRSRLSTVDLERIEILQETLGSIRTVIAKGGLAGKAKAAGKAKPAGKAKSGKAFTDENGNWHIPINFWSRTSARAGNEIVLHSGQDYNNAAFVFGVKPLRYGRVTDVTIWDTNAAGLRETIESVCKKRDSGVKPESRRLIQRDRVSSTRYTPECEVREHTAGGRFYAVITMPDDGEQTWAHVTRIYYRPDLKWVNRIR